MPRADSSIPLLVVTRPAHQAQALCQQLEGAGFPVIRFPVLAIESCADAGALNAVIQRLAEFDLAIFISTNAVDHGLAAITAQMPWPPQLKIAAIGQATARALQEHGLAADLVAPPPHDSEALLGMPPVRSGDYRRIVIFRGEGGRDHLAQSLREMGVGVEYANCYRRTRPAADDGALRRAWDSKQSLLFIVTSNQGLENLHDMISPAYRDKLLSSHFLVISPRIQAKARQLGIQGDILVAASAGDAAIVERVTQYRQQAEDA